MEPIDPTWTETASAMAAGTAMIMAVRRSRGKGHTPVVSRVHP